MVARKQLFVNIPLDLGPKMLLEYLKILLFPSYERIPL